MTNETPSRLKINSIDGSISWKRTDAGKYDISILVQNSVGQDQMTLKVKVRQTYTPILDPLPKTTFPNANPVLIQGKVHFEPNSYIRDHLSGIVPVNVVVVGSNGAKVVLQTLSET